MERARAFCLLYILIGLGYGYWFDSCEMKKDIPYEFMPAMLSIPQIRAVTYFMSALTGALQLVTYLLAWTKFFIRSLILKWTLKNLKR